MTDKRTNYDLDIAYGKNIDFLNAVSPYIRDAKYPIEDVKQSIQLTYNILTSCMRKISFMMEKISNMYPSEKLFSRLVNFNNTSLTVYVTCLKLLVDGNFETYLCCFESPDILYKKSQLEKIWKCLRYYDIYNVMGFTKKYFILDRHHLTNQLPDIFNNIVSTEPDLVSYELSQIGDIMFTYENYNSCICVSEDMCIYRNIKHINYENEQKLSNKNKFVIEPESEYEYETESEYES